MRSSRNILSANTGACNSPELLKLRETNGDTQQSIQSSFLMKRGFLDRLGLETELDGHVGCVNCIEWNSTGEILASGSDDLRLILWDPFKRQKLHTIETGHGGNIFSVKFVPQSGDSLIASGAGDGHVYVHRLGSSEKALSCSCHAGRVKRLATTADLPYMLWSSGEDGLVLQHDLRTAHSCSSGPSNILVNLVTHCGEHAEAKCVAVHPTQSHYMAVGANDPYVRVYDRRMIKTTSITYPSESNASRYRSIVNSSRTDELQNSLPLDSAQYFCPGHLPHKVNDYRHRFRTLAVTYVAFDPSGRYLLANIGGEHIYLFDWSNPHHSLAMDTPRPEDETSKPNGLVASLPAVLPAAAADLKVRANAAFEQREYSRAIVLYSRAIDKAPKAPVLYSNRAAAYLHRRWDGDAYAALRDCQAALTLDPDYAKAHFRFARCLFEMGWTSAANDRLQALKIRYPDQTVHKSLEREIQAALHKQQRRQADSERDEDSQGSSRRSPSPAELHWRKTAGDYSQRFTGHCNTTTDIKEANFLGGNAEYVIAGSDDGCFFVWDRTTGEIVRIMKGDESIVNCLQPHPSIALLASSGIDSLVRLWSPLPEGNRLNDRLVDDIESAAQANQRRMNADPYAQILLNMDFGVPDEIASRLRRRSPRRASAEAREAEAEVSDEEENEAGASVRCRQS